MCQFMGLPGRQHFQAANHLLHHIRCHPPRPLMFYKDVAKSPVVKMLKEVPAFEGHDHTYVVFADSSHADCDKRRSTASELHVFQGGLIDHVSWVPKPIPMSSAESENNCYSGAAMRSRFIKRAICHILYVSPDAPLTVPMCVDSEAAIAMNMREKPSKKTRHVESRYWYTRQCVEQAHIALIKVDGKTQQPADVGTKNLRDGESQYYRNLFEAPYYPN